MVIWLIAAITIVLILIRPWRVSEAVWACAGAALLVVVRILSPAEALVAVGRGTDVYLFLAGMMLLAELARREGFFDWIAAEAIHLAHGSRTRLFAIVYAVGTLVTIFLSNDATAVVLTPAVLAAVKKARATPLPYLLTCALIANAASFVLPISNPANLVVYGSAIPPLAVWLKAFAVPSLISIFVTYYVLRLTMRSHLHGAIAREVDQLDLSRSGKLAAFGIAGTGVVLILASAFGFDLGLPTFLAACAVTAVVAIKDRGAPLGIVKHISWSVLFLVAGLFVLVEGVDRAGALPFIRGLLQRSVNLGPTPGSMAAALVVGLSANIANNLPIGLIAGSVLRTASVPDLLRNAVLIAVDLGPNLSVTGSLATILWLVALRREGEDITFLQFLRFGVLAMVPALVFSVLALQLGSRAGG
ncbi:MAG TPA: arsenic transporter [Bryobacteraceae bacterium]|nr:arsenic transporter [Bryobacteraceae bacterium]